MMKKKHHIRIFIQINEKISPFPCDILTHTNKRISLTHAHHYDVLTTFCTKFCFIMKTIFKQKEEEK